MGFHLMVMLRSTMGPYGRPVIEVAYGEMILSLHWGCMGDDSSGRVVGVSAWCIAHVWHTWVNTSVGSVYIFFGFSRYKNLYVLCFQIYTYYKRTLVDFNLILARWDLENVFDRPWVFFQNRNWTTDDFYDLYCKWVLRVNNYYIIYWFFK